MQLAGDHYFYFYVSLPNYSIYSERVSFKVTLIDPRFNTVFIPYTIPNFLDVIIRYESMTDTIEDYVPQNTISIAFDEEHNPNLGYNGREFCGEVVYTYYIDDVKVDFN